jgi:hypothetical protein
VRRGTRTRPAARTVALALVLAIAGLTSVGAVAGETRALASTGVVVTLGSGSGVAVPRSFLGLATEYVSIPTYLRGARDFERLLSLLRPRDGSPLILRIGGLSADDALWTPALAGPLPARATALTPADMTQIGTLVRAQRLRVILDLNLAADVPGDEAALAAAAVADLPRGSIDALEIGNEPDYYRFALRDSPAYYPSSFTAPQYTDRFLSYAAALSRSAPGVPLAGPALANPVSDYGYLKDLVDGARGTVSMLTVHRYALSACARRSSILYPTITRLLRPQASVGLAATIARSVALAHANGLSIRWDELNSVTCGGTLGVSDSFASALWTTDTLFAALAVGVDGVNVQMRPTALNAPFYLTSAGVAPRPMLYGMLLFQRALGRGARRLVTHIVAPPAANVTAWAVRLGGRRLNVVALNKGDGPETLLLRLGRLGAGTVQRLLAASIRTRSRVTLAGQSIGADGRWSGRFRATRIAWSGGGYRLTLPPFSGALISLAGAGRRAPGSYS